MALWSGPCAQAGSGQAPRRNGGSGQPSDIIRQRPCETSGQEYFPHIGDASVAHGFIFRFRTRQEFIHDGQQDGVGHSGQKDRRQQDVRQYAVRLHGTRNDCTRNNGGRAQERFRFGNFRQYRQARSVIRLGEQASGGKPVVRNPGTQRHRRRNLQERRIFGQHRDSRT